MALAAVLALGVLVVVTRVGRSDGLPGWVRALNQMAKAPSGGPWKESSSAPLAKSTPSKKAEFRFPDPASWDVRLGRSGAPSSTHDEPAKTAVKIASRVDWAAGQTLHVTVLDQATSTRLGTRGFTFTVADGAASRTEGGLHVTMTVDYSAFAHSYGAGYADRLQITAAPSCVLAQPIPADCDTTPVRLEATNNPTAQTLTVDVPDLGTLARAGTVAAVAGPRGDSRAVDTSSATAVMSVSSTATGSTGGFTASPLSATGSWQVGEGSGEFSYSYPMAMPKPGVGQAPTVGLGYSSGAVDGMTTASNAQAGPSGLGWSDFANAFIERSYLPCTKLHLGDLCWTSDNATISLGGITGAMYAANPEHTKWKIENDPGWQVERRTNGVNSSIYQGQYWVVTGPDGTQYFFGVGHMPGIYTNSVLGVSVLADDSGEPCRGPNDTVGGCQQGWRWYLDRIEDPNENVTSFVYSKETTWYSALNGFDTDPNKANKATTSYDRAALLSQIYYGGRDWDKSEYGGRVTFGLQYRCYYLVDQCVAATADNSDSFPDVPNDLICAHNTTCSIHSPAFYTDRRYAWVKTEVKVGADWMPVTQYNLLHSFGDNQNGVPLKLRLDGVQQAAIALGKLNAYPNTTFEYEYRDNRADNHADITTAMRHYRLDKITNSFGGVTTVQYGQNHGCNNTMAVPSNWNSNTFDCFPQAMIDQGHTNTAWFYKYLVKSVTENPGQGGPVMTTSYTYEGDPVWLFDPTSFDRDEDDFGWNRWGGYGTFRITNGTSMTRLRVFRGVDQDVDMELIGSTPTPTGTKHVSIGYIDSDTPTFPDAYPLAGRVLEEQQLGTVGGVANSVISSRRYTYKVIQTFDPDTVDPRIHFRRSANWAGVENTTERVTMTPTTFKERRSTTTYQQFLDPTNPASVLNVEPSSTLEEGWLDASGDERCSTTTYAVNAANGMYNYPAVNQKLAGTCASTTVLTHTETYYDKQPLGVGPTFGDVTSLRTWTDSSGAYIETRTEYDAGGRPIDTWDGNNNHTHTDYAVTSGGFSTDPPIRVTVTNPLQRQTVTDYQPEFSEATRVQDANGNVTSYGYDEFGRVATIWLPTEPLDFAQPSYQFSYDIPNKAIRTRRLTSDDRVTNPTYLDTWVIYDGFWRKRQEQSLSPVASKALVAETTYDERGLVKDETVEQALPGAPGAYLGGGTSWLNRTRHGYDEAGRETSTVWFRGTSPFKTTTTTYGADTVTVTGLDASVTGQGGRSSRQTTDGLGRTIATAELDGTTWVTTTLGYNLADNLTTVKDPDGNTTSHIYDMAGRRIGQIDNNRGNLMYNYDANGNQTLVLDQLNNVTITAYDALNRPTERHSGSATGPLLASWTYDTAPLGKGRLASQTSVTPSGNWVSTVTGYDAKGRTLGTSTTVPAGLPGLSGTYTVSQTYDRSDHVRTVTYPTIGGLPAETVTTTFDTLGQPTKMVGLENYVWNATYDDRGRPVSTGLGPQPNGTTWLATNVGYDADQRAFDVITYLSNSTSVPLKHTLSYDLAGNVVSDQTVQNGQTWLECFGYDARSRLTSARTVPANTSCDGAQAGGGDQPYAHSYTYSVSGKLTARTEGGVTTTYTYPAAGAAQSLAPTNVGNDTYQWNVMGDLTSRTVAGKTETFTWDDQGRLASVAPATGNPTQFQYDASGQRVLRKAPDGRTTVYVAGHELSANADGSGVSAVRSYAFNGKPIATRTTPSKVDYILSGGTGSVEMAIPSGATPAASRDYYPYGNTRSTTGTFTTQKGFVGQVEDGSTKLSYLNARYYDATTGVFISPDPVMDTSQVKSVNPYSYGFNNPTTFSDPGGTFSARTDALERSVLLLTAQNKMLLDHIGVLNGQLEQLQDIIKEQQKEINKMLTYINALEAEIARQASIIRQLQDRVRYLEGVVASQRREISRLRGVIAYQNGVIRYQRGVIGQLVQFAFLPQYQAGVLTSIDAGNGITSWEGSRLDLVSFVNKWLIIGQDVNLSPTDVTGLISLNLSRGASLAEIDKALVFASAMRTDTAYANDQMDAQRATLKILHDHYAYLDQLSKDGLKDLGCYVGSELPGVVVPVVGAPVGHAVAAGCAVAG